MIELSPDPRDIHVTSSGQLRLSERLGEEFKPIFTNLRSAVPATDVDGPGFGAVGELTFAGTYSEVQRLAERLLTDAEEVITGWQKTLAVGATNWRTAEDKSMVRHL